MTAARTYAGTIERWAPMSPGFAPVAWEDARARARAHQLAQATLRAGRAGTLGDAPGDDTLSLWSYRDERLDDGQTYRFFRYAHPAGEAIAALRFVGGTLGQVDTTAVVDAAQRVSQIVDRNALCVLNNPTVRNFQIQYNAWIDAEAADPNFSGPLPAKITVDGDYGKDTQAAVNETLGGGAPDQCTTYGGGGGGGGQTTNEPVPGDDASCHYVADATNAQIVAMANSISYNNTPVTWRDQGTYATQTTDGTKWLLVMWWESGRKMVAAYRCDPKTGPTPTPPTPPPPSGGSSSSSSGAAIAIVLGLLAAAGGAWAYSSGKI